MQTSHPNELIQFVVTLVEEGASNQTCFSASAEDIEHAISQATNAYPGAMVTAVSRVEGPAFPGRFVFPAMVEVDAQCPEDIANVLAAAPRVRVTPFEGVDAIGLEAGVRVVSLADFVGASQGAEVPILDLPVIDWNEERVRTTYRLQVAASAGGFSFRAWERWAPEDGAQGLEGVFEINHDRPGLHLSPRLTTENVMHLHSLEGGRIEVMEACSGMNRTATKSEVCGAPAHVYAIPAQR